MADIEIFGLLRGKFKREAYTFESDGRTISVRERPHGSKDGRKDWEVAVRWRHAPADERDEEVELQGWFESFLLASSVSTGSSVTVVWDGIHRYEPDGTWGVGKTLSQPFRFVRRHPERFGESEALAADVRRHAEVREASSHLRYAMAIAASDAPIAAAAAYIAIEGLVVSTGARSWQEFGSLLSDAGATTTADDLEYLWASCQLYRHDPAKTKKAWDLLGDRDPLAATGCCYKAAEVMEEYVALKRTGASVKSAA